MGTQPPPNGAQAWSLGVLRFSDIKSADETIKKEHGASLDKQSNTTVTVEAGVPRQDVGWCEGVVMQYLPNFGLGLMRSAQLEGDVHFEAPPKLRFTGLDMQGMRVDARVEYGSDGSPQSREVRVKPDKDSRQDRDRPRKKGKQDRGPMPQMVHPGAMVPWGMAGWGSNDPYYKTQPCPYHRQGMCQMSQGCHFAHSPEELRAVPESMMMSHFARMMGGKGGAALPLQKKKKDKSNKEP